MITSNFNYKELDGSYLTIDLSFLRSEPQAFRTGVEVSILRRETVDVHDLTG